MTSNLLILKKIYYSYRECWMLKREIRENVELNNRHLIVKKVLQYLWVHNQKQHFNQSVSTTMHRTVSVKQIYMIGEWTVGKIWKSKLASVPNLPRYETAAAFQMVTGHDGMLMISNL